MSLQAVIAAYTTGTYKVFRTSEGDYVDGHYVRVTEIDADVSVVSSAINTLTIVDHGLSDGDGPYYLTTDDTLPGGLSTLTPYWVIVVDDDNIQLASTREEALAATPIDLTDDGAGTQHIANFFLADLSVQPQGGAGLKDLPEGQHTEATFVIWSLVELKDRSPGWEPDVIEINGELWRVQSLDYYGILSSHWKATVERMTTP